jgi:hypothetical protein
LSGRQVRYWHVGLQRERRGWLRTEPVISLPPALPPSLSLSLSLSLTILNDFKKMISSQSSSDFHLLMFEWHCGDPGLRWDQESLALCGAGAPAVLIMQGPQGLAMSDHSRRMCHCVTQGSENTCHIHVPVLYSELVMADGLKGHLTPQPVTAPSGRVLLLPLWYS